MLSIAIDAKEERDVACCDIVGAYLNAHMKKLIYMVYEGDMVDYMIQSNLSKYQDYVHVNHNGKKQLYVRLNKALYGCIESAKLWYDMLADTLVNKMKFIINPYDPCVANRMINGSQCTICWYVDDLKISHADKAVVQNIINQLEDIYGKMTVTRGKSHVYVGTNITYGSDREAYINMVDHIKEAIDDFPEECISSVNSPAGMHLFEVNSSDNLIPENERRTFHKIVAKLLFISNRARPDIVVPISFLTSRVTKATNDDWKKLKRVLCYLNNTIDMKLTLSIDNASVLKTWVDASYACHNDMRSHTGGAI